MGEDDHAVDKNMHPEIGNRNISFHHGDGIYATHYVDVKRPGKSCQHKKAYHRRCWLEPMSSQARHFLSLSITYKVVNHLLI